MANTNLDNLFDNLKNFNLTTHNLDDAVRACKEKFKVDNVEKENPFLVIAMYQAMGVVHMAQTQQAILAELGKINTRLKKLEEAIDNSAKKISLT